LKIKLMEELKKGKRSFYIPSLFPGKAEFRRTYYAKVTPQNSVFMRVFLMISGFAIALSPFLMPLGRIKLRDETKRKFVIQKQLYLPAQILLSIACVLTVLYLIALAKNPQVITLGPPRSLQGFPPIISFLIHIPVLLSAIVPCMIILLTSVLRRRLWSAFLRVFYAILTVLLAADLALFFYWGLVKIIM
jgi:hypothetical protein